jgi:hypothetical protein
MILLLSMGFMGHLRALAVATQVIDRPADLTVPFADRVMPIVASRFPVKHVQTLYSANVASSPLRRLGMLVQSSASGDKLRRSGLSSYATRELKSQGLPNAMSR